jgi:hypothetical protein
LDRRGEFTNSAFDRTSGHSADNIALEDQGEDHRRESRQDAARHHASDVDRVTADEFGDGHGSRLGGQGAGEDKGVEEFIPGKKKNEHGGGDQPRYRDGHDDAE